MHRKYYIFQSWACWVTEIRIAKWQNYRQPERGTWNNSLAKDRCLCEWSLACKL